MAAPSNQPMNGFPFPLTSPHRKSSKHGIQHIFTHKKIHNTNCKLYWFDITTGRQGRNLQLNCNKTQTITFAQHQYTRNTNFIAMLHPAASLLIRAFVGDIKVINRADLALPSWAFDWRHRRPFAALRDDAGDRALGNVSKMAHSAMYLGQRDEELSLRISCWALGNLLQVPFFAAKLVDIIHNLSPLTR